MSILEKYKSWSIQDIINHIQRRIIVYSIMYYEYNESCVTDKEYDELSKQLVELSTHEEYEKSNYYYAMHDFDGSTGFDIYSKLNEKDKEYLSKIARYVLRLYKIDNVKGGRK